jgi:hypothetical protein
MPVINPPPTEKPMKLSNGAAILLTLVFLGVSIWLLATYGTGEHGWDHAVVVYNALTSIAFTAAGVLLGTKVQQVNVDKANADAKHANDEAGKKSGAIKSALTALDGSAGRSVQEDGGGTATVDSITSARSILQQALS